MKKFLPGIILILLSLSVPSALCYAMDASFTLNGKQYSYFSPDSFFDSQYAKGYLDYEGMIEGGAYNSSVDFVWLDPDVKFSNYKKLTIIELENWTGKKSIKARGEEYDISETVTGAFAMESRLRKNFASVRRGKEENTRDGLILKGVVTRVDKGVPVHVYTELSLVDAGTQKEVGKLIVEGSNVLFRLAAARVSTLVGDLIAEYLNHSPGFDPRPHAEPQPAPQHK